MDAFLPKIETVIICTPSCCFKLVCIFFFCKTQKKTCIFFSFFFSFGSYNKSHLGPIQFWTHKISVFCILHKSYRIEMIYISKLTLTLKFHFWMQSVLLNMRFSREIRLFIYCCSWMFFSLQVKAIYPECDYDWRWKLQKCNWAIFY